MKAVTAEQMREIEQRSVAAGVSLDTLMENAGHAVAIAVEAHLGKIYGASVTILVGPGNNGSDGLVAGRRLASRGARVRAFALTGRPDSDPKRKAAEGAGVEFIAVASNDPGHSELRRAVAHCNVVIDAVLGTGRARPITEPFAGILAAVRGALSGTSVPVFAVDLPTGTDAESGAFDANGLPASKTLMLGYPKVGPLVTAGDGLCGEIRVVDIGIPAGLADHIQAELLTNASCAGMLPARPLGSNKGTFGRTLIVGGSRNYLGAPLLAARAAVRSGVGLAYLATPEPVHSLIAGQVQEAIYLPLPADAGGDIGVNAACTAVLDAADGMDSIVIGPGLGQSVPAIGIVEQLIRTLPPEVTVVLDADALNIVARMPLWPELLSPPRILTPHPGEMARLLGKTVAEVQKDRVASVREAASRFSATVVLKGAATLIASPDGQLKISPWVNSGLAKAGTGDVLAGLLGGLVAQDPGRPLDMAALAVYVHGLAGDAVRNETGERGMTAGDVASGLPSAFLALERR